MSPLPNVADAFPPNSSCYTGPSLVSVPQTELKIPQKVTVDLRTELARNHTARSMRSAIFMLFAAYSTLTSAWTVPVPSVVVGRAAVGRAAVTMFDLYPSDEQQKKVDKFRNKILNPNQDEMYRGMASAAGFGQSSAPKKVQKKVTKKPSAPQPAAAGAGVGLAPVLGVAALIFAGLLVSQ